MGSARNVYKELLNFTDDQSDVNDMDFDKDGLCQIEPRKSGVDDSQYYPGDYLTHKMTEAIGNMRLGVRHTIVLTQGARGMTATIMAWWVGEITPIQVVVF